MRKKVKGGKVTTDKLAIMMNDGFETLRKDIAGVEGKLTLEIKGVKNQLEGTNKRIDDLAFNRVKYEDHNKLEGRVDVIEKNMKTPG